MLKYGYAHTQVCLQYTYVYTYIVKKEGEKVERSFVHTKGCEQKLHKMNS
jgi:hypothetical protein